MKPSRIAGLVFLLCGASVPRVAAEGAVGEPQTYMRKLGFQDSEIADLEKGKVAARVVPEPDDNEASVFAVVRIDAAPEALVEGIRHIERFRSAPSVLQTGRFGKPPSIEDLAPLTFDKDDLDDFGKCRVAACELQAPADGMALAKQVDWKAKDAYDQATRLLKQSMFQVLETYLAKGTDAMVVYNNNEVPLSVRVELEKILHNSANLAHYNPEFLAYLLDYPKVALPDAEDFVYWSKEKLRKSVVSVVHVVIQRVVSGGATGYFIAMKHIYDTHYFLADAEFLTLVPAPGGKGFYLIHAIRARIDPPHTLRGMLLGKIKGAMKDALAEDARAIKQRLEAAAHN